MYMAARVRLFCVPGPKGNPEGDISYRYLSAFHRRGICVRAIPLVAINFAEIARPVDPDDEEDDAGHGYREAWQHWGRLSASFTEPVATGCVNVVCCSPGTMYGVNRTVKDASGGMSDSEDRASESGMALCELLTSNVTNIAITNFSTEPTPAELDALRNYDRVICYRLGDVERFREAGVEAFLLPPNDFVATIDLFAKEVPAT